MKKLLTILALSVAVISQASFAADTNSEAKQEVKSNKYQTEANHTSVSWTANHFGFSDVSGKFTDVSGIVIFDEKKPEKSSVEVTIKIAALETGLPKLNTHLKSADFLNADKFPTATFVSKKVTLAGTNKARIDGDLTLLGITKPVSLIAKFNKSGISPVNQKATIGFSATGSIKRSDFGIKYALPGVSDKVDLAIELEANQ